MTPSDLIDQMLADQPHPYGTEETACAGAMWDGGYSTALLVLKEKITEMNP